MSETSPPDGTSNYRDPNASRDWLRQLMSVDRLCEEYLSARRNLLKRMKAAGENTAEARKAIRLSRMTNEDAISSTRDLVYYMAMRNIPVTQDSLFAFDRVVSEQTSREDAIWKSHDLGYYAGRHGVPTDECPYNPGSEFHVRWTAGWHDGQAAMVRELGPDEKPAVATRKRPRQARIPGTEAIQRRPPPDPEPVRKMARKAAARKKQRKRGNRRRLNGPTIAGDGVPVY